MIQLKNGSYKGVDILFTEATTVGGNRLIKYLYPGSDTQSIERQGKLPRSYPMQIWIPHENYYQERENLIRVLEDGVAGTFVHPTWGDVENVMSGRYELREVISELGRAVVTVTLEVDNSPGVPLQSGNLASQVETLSTATNEQLQADLGSTFEVSTSLTGNFTDALESVTSVFANLERAAEVVTPAAEGLSAFRATISNLTASVGTLVQAPAQLASEIEATMADIYNLFAAPEDALAAFRYLFDYGDGDVEIVPNTVARAQRKANRGSVRTTVQASALSYAYLSAVQIDYETTDALDEVQDALEAQYVQLRTEQEISNEGLEQLDRLRVQALKTLDDVRVNTREIVTIETRMLPLSVLVYTYYGSTDLVDTIAELNDVQQNAFVEGSVRMLTA